MNHLVVSLVVLVARLGGVLSLLCRLLSGKSIRKSSAGKIYGLAVSVAGPEHLTSSEVWSHSSINTHHDLITTTHP